MNIEDIAKDMARDGYNPKDDGANNRALKNTAATGQRRIIVTLKT